MLLRPRQSVFVERSLAALDEYRNTLGVAPTGCHIRDTPILLFDGTLKRVQDIVVGDQIMGPDSHPRRVLQLHRGHDNLYTLVPRKGEPFTVNAGHILSLVSQNTIRNISVLAYLAKPRAFKRSHRLYRAAVDFKTVDEPAIEPYTMGLLTGDAYVLNNTTAIDHGYKVASRHHRAAFLAGLIDACGEAKTASVELSLRAKTLADDVAFLARSLGFYTVIRCVTHQQSEQWYVVLQGDFRSLPCQKPHKKPLRCLSASQVLTTDFEVHEAGEGEYFGFSVDGDHLYVMGDFTVTHNSGKTIMLSAVAGQRLKKHRDKKACVLAHRDELTTQNEAKFCRVNPTLSTSVVDANQKSWAGQATFAMVQTLSRPSALKQIPALDLLVIDEAHHAAADSYRRVIDAVLQRNPHAEIYGVTATPTRADGKGLREIFSNVADQITVKELIASGHLVTPITYDIDTGQRNALQSIRGSAHAMDLATERLLNTRPTNEAVVKHWQDKAGDRKTIVFCSTVGHATEVAASFVDKGICVECIHGGLSTKDREAALARYESGESQVIVNVAVLTEGYDYPPTSCVVLLRLSSHKSTVLQMIGRGLRTVNPTEYPGIIKTDCIVLDFGTSTSAFGRLEESINLDGAIAGGAAPMKRCPDCEADVPAASKICALCGHGFDVADAEGPIAVADFVMNEVDIINRSLFQWSDLLGDGAALMATGFEAWAGLFCLEQQWYAVAGLKKQRATVLAVGQKTIGLAAADDWLNQHETEKSALKTRRWLNQSATEQQLQFLNPRYRRDYTLTRYHASCLLAFKFNKRDIQALVFARAKQDKQETAA